MGAQLVQLNESGSLDIAGKYNLTVHPRTGIPRRADTFCVPHQGVDDIKEYMQFILPISPYISANGLLYDEKSVVNFDEEKRSCVFLFMYHTRFQMSEMGGNELFETAC